MRQGIILFLQDNYRLLDWKIWRQHFKVIATQALMQRMLIIW